MTKRIIFRIASTVITTLVFLYAVYVLLSFVAIGGTEIPLEELGNDHFLQFIQIIMIAIWMPIIWAFLRKRYWWIPALFSVFVFCSVFAAGAALVGLIGLIVAPYVFCLIMILFRRMPLFGGDDDGPYGDPTDTTYYGLDKL